MMEVHQVIKKLYLNAFCMGGCCMGQPVYSWQTGRSHSLNCFLCKRDVSHSDQVFYFSCTFLKGTFSYDNDHNNNIILLYACYLTSLCWNYLTFFSMPSAYGLTVDSKIMFCSAKLKKNNNNKKKKKKQQKKTNKKKKTTTKECPIKAILLSGFTLFPNATLFGSFGIN